MKVSHCGTRVHAKEPRWKQASAQQVQRNATAAGVVPATLTAKEPRHRRQVLTAAVDNPKPGQGQWCFHGQMGQPDSTVPRESPRVLANASARLLQAQLEEELGGKSQAKVSPWCTYLHVTFVLSLCKLPASRSHVCLNSFVDDLVH